MSTANVTKRRGQRGIALIVVLLALMLLTGLAGGLALNTSLEGMIAANFRDAQEAFYAADAGVERAMADLAATGDWSAILDGSRQSSFVDGVPGGTRRLADGSTVPLATVSTQAGVQWRVYGYGWLRDMLPPGALDSPYYLVMMVAGDPADPGHGVLELRVESFGPRGARKAVDVTVAQERTAQSGTGHVRIVSWRARR